MKVLESGQGEVKLSDMDEIREWMREKKSRALEEKLMSEREAISKFLNDGDYLSYDLCGLIRGPFALERKIVRQKKKNLWVCAKFTLLDTSLLVGGGCVSKIDVGFAGIGRALYGATQRGEVRCIDWSNGTLALRHLAGSMGIPFIPTRSLKELSFPKTFIFKNRLH